MFLFVPETFWDRTPRPQSKTRRAGFTSLSRIFSPSQREDKAGISAGGDGSMDIRKFAIGNAASELTRGTIAERRRQRNAQHVGFADQAHGPSEAKEEDLGMEINSNCNPTQTSLPTNLASNQRLSDRIPIDLEIPRPLTPASHNDAARVLPRGEGPPTPGLHNFNSPFYVVNEKPDTDYMKNEHETQAAIPTTLSSAKSDIDSIENAHLPQKEVTTTPNSAKPDPPASASGGPLYTHYLRTQPPQTYAQTLKPWNGKLRTDNWLLVAIRPFILFAYPSILWSALVYSLSIGWLIVLSESVSSIFQNKESYNFTALQTGLVYVSPFVGGVLGTAVAGKVSDIIVRFMSRRNGGVYEPEFRLVMAIPVTISTCVGLMGFGWSAEEKDNWIVPTVFFGIISFGCSLGSTTAITFAVDSYRQYAGEALVTLNVSKSKVICIFMENF